MATDLARARSQHSRANADPTRSTKRPYQPTLAAYFHHRQTASAHHHNSSSSGRLNNYHGEPSSRASADAPPFYTASPPPTSHLRPLDSNVQASLLNVGMRVRKAVSGGYQFQQQYLSRYQKPLALDIDDERRNKGKENVYGGSEMEDEDGRAGSAGTRSAIMTASDILPDRLEDGFRIGRRKRRFEERGDEDDALAGATSRHVEAASTVEQRHRRLAQPATRLWLRRRLPIKLMVDQSARGEVVMTEGMVISPRGDDFEEAPFLLPRQQVDGGLLLGEGAMDID